MSGSPEGRSSPTASADPEEEQEEQPRGSSLSERGFGPGLSGKGSLEEGSRRVKRKPSRLRGSNSNLQQPLLGDSDDEEENVKEWGRTSRVQVSGYLPDLEPLLRPKESEERMVFKRGEVEDREAPQTPTKARNHSPHPATPLIALFKRRDGEPRVSLKQWFREGTVRGSVFNLCSATLGAGTLSLPYAFSKTGVLLGMTMLIVAGFATMYSIELLILCREATGLRSYEDMTVALFGKRLGLVVELNIIIFCFGTAVAYCKALQGILDPILILADAPHWLSDSNGKKLAISIFWVVIMFPLSLIKKMNSLRFSSFFGVAAIFYLVFAAGLHSGLHGGFHAERWSSGGGKDYPSLFAPMSFLDVVQAMPIMMFAFTCQVNVFAIYSELERPSLRRMNMVSRGAVGICFIVYALMGVFGFSDPKKETSANILDNYCIMEHSDPYIMVGFVAITITILMAFPLNIFPCRYTIETMLSSRSIVDIESMSPSHSAILNFFLTLMISGSALLVSLYVPDIGLVFGLMGGTASAFVCFVLPAAFAIKVGVVSGSQVKSALVWALAIGGGSIGALSTAVTIYQTTRPNDSDTDYCDSAPAPPTPNPM